MGGIQETLQKDEHLDSILMEDQPEVLVVPNLFISHTNEVADSSYTVNEFLKKIFPYMLFLMDSSRGSIALKSQNPFTQDKFYIVTHEGIQEEDIGNKLISFENAPYIQEALVTGEAVFVDKVTDSYKDPSIVVPFGWDNVRQGAVCLSSKYGGYSVQEASVLETCMRFMGNPLGRLSDKRKIEQVYNDCVGMHDQYTAIHNSVVGQLSMYLAAECGFSISDQQIIGIYGDMHDVGKLGVEHEILTKKSKLTDDEYAIIKNHVEMGRKLLGSNVLSSKIGEAILLYHHERWDGKGYLEGLAGEKIPKAARIVSVADTFHAMAGGRCYSGKSDRESVINELKRCAGTQFDPEIVEKFIGMLPSIAFTQQRNGEEKILFHSPFCEHVEYTPAKGFLVGRIADILNTPGYSPCPSCMSK